MNGKFWKWLNRIFATGIWLQPFVMAGLILFFRAVFGQRPSILSLFFLSWLPSVYVWSENQRQRAAGKTEFGIEDTFHDRPTQYESPLKMQAMYPKIDERFLFDAPEGVVLGKTEIGTISRQTKYLCKPMEGVRYTDGHALVIGGSGSGKSSAILIPTLLSVSHIGLFCIDIKGELWSKTRRLDDDRVVIVDFQDRNLFGWDALAALNRKASPSDQDIREQMEEIADSLIPISAKDSQEFWKQSARSLLIGELVGLYKQKHIHDLAALVNGILSRDSRELVQELMGGAAPGAVEVKYLSSFEKLADETFSGVCQQQEEALKAKTEAALANNKKEAATTADSSALFFNAMHGTDSKISIQNNVAEITFATKGGRVYSATLKEYMAQDKKTPIVLFDGDDASMNFNFYNKEGAIQTKDYFFEAVNKTDSSVTMRLAADSASYIDFIYTLKPDSYLMNFEIKATGMEDKLASTKLSHYIMQKRK